MQISFENRKNTYPVAFSYGFAAVAAKAAIKKDVKNAFTGGVLQVINIAGYIPGVATIVGIARIIFCCMYTTKENNDAAMKEAMIVRGSIEILSIAGPLLILADVVGTVALALMLKK